MKKIILDLETTNLSPFKAEILEICVLFVEDDVVIREFCDYIKFEKNYNELDESTLLSIHFNKIYSQEDLDMHNKKARNRRNVISDLLCKVQDFGVGISISGWNNACYDNIVLRRALEELGYNYLAPALL
jgi:DNA polymerase III alpha subunit (gram-positive type)